VRHERVVGRISWRAVLLHTASDGIRHRMRKVHARTAEPDAGKRRREHHVSARFVIIGMVECPHEMGRDHAECLQRPHVADRIATLICRTQRRPRGTRPIGERDHGV